MMIPETIVLSPDKQQLQLHYADEVFSYRAQWLRENSPSAEVQGHGPGQKITVTGVENVCILQIDPVGNYAVKLHFDDGHNSGIFTWEYFHSNRENATIEAKTNAD